MLLFFKHVKILPEIDWLCYHPYSAGKTSGVLRGGASGANRCYVLAHCGGGTRGKKENNDVFSGH